MSSTLKGDLKKLESLSHQFNTVVNHATNAAIAEAKNKSRKRKSASKAKKTASKPKRKSSKSKKN